MCVMCALPAGEKLSLVEFENMWDNNPDGGGFTYLTEDGKMETFKSMKYKEFEDAFKAAHEKRGKFSPFLVHTRIASRGSVSLDNVHPFIVPGHEAVMAHNGTITHVNKDNQKSDTRLFVEQLAHLPPEFWRDERIKAFIENLIGSGNKLVFLDTEGKFQIVNEKAGVVDNGRWFSNNSFRYAKTYPAQSAYGGMPYEYSSKGKNEHRTVFWKNQKRYVVCYTCGSIVETRDHQTHFVQSQQMCSFCTGQVSFLQKTVGMAGYVAQRAVKAAYEAQRGTLYIPIDESKETEGIGDEGLVGSYYENFMFPI